MQISQLGQARLEDIFMLWLNVKRQNIPSLHKKIIKLCVLCSCVQYQDGQKRRKPNYSSVDLSEVEWEDKDDIVRVKLLK